MKKKIVTLLSVVLGFLPCSLMAQRLVELKSLADSVKNYEEVDDFWCGMAMVRNNKNLGYINTKGQLVIDTINNFTRPGHDFRNGYVVVEKDNKAGVLDTNSREVVPLKYKYVSVGTDAIALLEDDKGNYSSVNLKNGVTTSLHEYTNARGFVDGYMIVQTKKWSGCVDTAYNVLFMGDYKNIAYCREGFFTVKNDKEEMFLIDKNGKIKKMDSKYDIVGDFSNGYVMIKDKGRYGVMDKDLNVVIEPVYDYFQCWHIDSYEEKLSDFLPFAIINGDEAYILDKKGNKFFTINGNFSLYYLNGLFIVNILDEIAYFVNKNGDILWKEKNYTSIKSIGHDMFLVYKGSECGVVNLKGEVVLPFEYNHATGGFYGGGLLCMWKDSERSYFQISDK